MLCIAALCSLFTYCIISYFIFPVADDLSYAQQGLDNIWSHYKINYLNWCGRYFSNFLILLNCYISTNIVLYRLYPVFLIVITFLSVYVFIKRLNKNVNAGLPVFLFSLLFISLYLNMMPQTAEGLYWYTGSATYILPAFLFILYVLLMIQYFKGAFVLNKFFHVFLMAILVVLIVGFNEALMLLFTCLHGILFLFLKKNGKRSSWFVLIFMLLCIAFGLIIILAPGNENRSGFFPEKHRFFYSLSFACIHTVRFFAKWIVSFPLILFSFLYLPYAKKINESFDIRKLSSLPWFFILGFLLFIPFCAVFPPYWATGMLGQYRTLNTVLIVFLLAWILFLHIIADKYLNDQEVEVLSTRKIKLMLSTFLILSLFLTGNGGTVMYDLFSGKAKRFKEQQTQRNEMFVEAKRSGQGSIAVDLLRDKPESIFVLDLTVDSTHWINYSYASYYGLNSVKGK